MVVSHVGDPAPQRDIGDWLDTPAYEAAGRAARSRPGDLALVQVDDIRQALAWLCGRTAVAATCALANTTAAVPLWRARPYVSGNPSLPRAGSPQPR